VHTTESNRQPHCNRSFPAVAGGLGNTAGGPVIVGTLSPGMVITELFTGPDEATMSPAAKRTANILADRVETVAPLRTGFTRPHASVGPSSPARVIQVPLDPSGGDALSSGVGQDEVDSDQRPSTAFKVCE